jgi:hypothetical protein
MQIMAVTLDEPKGSVTPEGTDRIWLITRMLDCSGSAEVGMPERVALQLTGLDRASFLEAHVAGTLQFPLLCNLRASRSITQPAASQLGADAVKKIFVNSVIQEAVPIEWTAAAVPNAAYDGILAI